MKIILALAVALVSVNAFAINVKLGEVNNQFEAVGPHYPLFVVKKSYNPENLLSVYTRLDDKCQVIPDTTRQGKPTLNFYWLMNGETYKPMNSILESGVRKRLLVEAQAGNPMGFLVTATDLREVKHDLPSQTLQIKTEKTNKGCFAQAMLKLGPAHKGETIRVESFFADADFGGNVDKVIIEGVNAKGQKITAEYQGAR